MLQRKAGKDRLLLIAVVRIFSAAIFSRCFAAGNLYLRHSKRNRNAVRARTCYERVKSATRTTICELCEFVCVRVNARYFLSVTKFTAHSGR